MCDCVVLSSHLVWGIRIERICYNNHSCSILPQNMDQHSFLRIVWALTLEIAALHPYICTFMFERALRRLCPIGSFVIFRENFRSKWIVDIHVYMLKSVA